MLKMKLNSYKLAAAGVMAFSALTGLLAPATASAAQVSGTATITFDNTVFAASNSYGDIVKKYWGANDNSLPMNGSTAGGTTLPTTGSTGPLAFPVNTNNTTITYDTSSVPLTYGRTVQATTMDAGNTSAGQIGLSGALQLNNVAGSGLVTPNDFSLVKTAGNWNIRSYDNGFGYQNIWTLTNASESLNGNGDLLLSGNLIWTPNSLWKSLVGGTSDVLGTFNLAPSAVPVPAAVWLFGSALMGFLGLQKRKIAA